jgi:hypothetical protein
MKAKSQTTLTDGLKCKVTAGTHAWKTAIVSDMNYQQDWPRYDYRDAKKWREIQNPGQKHRRSEGRRLTMAASQTAGRRTTKFAMTRTSHPATTPALAGGG